ncbi:MULTISPECIES: AAA+ family ATPase [unclassified Yoonia]|uniref:AAA+ family ATPase n=1 Tax=unclassified Yoonia TaxID=2629118 RepID=UPI002AFDF3D7|nr:MULTISPECIES: AAA+ family ATPase [unclassified Yoonia]
MRLTAITLVLTVLLAGPAPAQSADDAPSGGFNLVEEGARMIMRGLIEEMSPTIDSLRDTLEEMGPVVGDFLREMGPGLATFLNRVDDVRHYELPEFLPNGDIIMRRKPTAPLFMPDTATDGGEIEL